MDNKEIGNISVYENEDGKAVWEFKGLVTSDVPLDTESQHFAGAINELAKKLQQEGGGDEWQLPESFPDIPDPTSKQIIILVEVSSKSVGRPMLDICPMPYTFDGSEYIDWGDGSRVIIKPDDVNYARDYSHAYNAAGLYVITINCSELTKYIYLNKVVNSTFVTGGSFPPLGVDTSFNGLDASNGYIRVIKFGENIYSETIIYSGNNFTGLVYVKYCGNSYNISAEKLGEDRLDRLWHYGCAALCRVDFDVLPEKIPNLMFYGCTALRNAPFAKNLTEIPQSTFRNCTALLSADISAAKTVGASAFQNCTSLSDLKYSKDCTFDGGALENCLCLYPKPN